MLGWILGRDVIGRDKTWKIRYVRTGSYDFFFDEIDSSGIVFWLEPLDLLFKPEYIGTGKLAKRLIQEIVDRLFLFQILVPSDDEFFHVLDLALWEILVFDSHRNTVPALLAKADVKIETILDFDADFSDFNSPDLSEHLSSVILDIFEKTFVVRGNERLGTILHDFQGALEKFGDIEFRFGGNNRWTEWFVSGP